MSNFEKEGLRASAGAAAEKVSAAMLEEIFKDSFAKLDTDKNGFASEAELKAAQQSGQLSDKEKIMVNIVSSQRSNLQSLANDEWGFERKGVSLKDMAKFKDLATNGGADKGWRAEMMSQVNSELSRQYTNNPYTFSHLLKQNFAEIDLNKDGKISRQEAQDTAINPSLSIQTRELGSGVLNVYDQMRGLTGGKNQDLTLGDSHRLSYLLNPDQGFKTDLSAAKRENYGIGGLLAGTSALSAVGAGVIARGIMLDPDPVSKMYGVAALSIYGAISYFTGRSAYRHFKEPTNMRHEFEKERSQVLDWNYFRR